MVKILREKYPLGSFKGQKTEGRYMDGYLHNNLRILAKRIVKDMTFLGVCFSSTLEVGTGKSVFCTQMGEAWSELMKEEHGIDIPFSSKNIVWRPKELIERAFQVPKYSFLLLDEWEDATYWSELGVSLRSFFRKCRQLNLFIMVIIPNWFQMNMGYAISRSVFAIDVKFENEFQRGFFDFYSFKSKRLLYIKGKKEHNYSVARSDFSGRFTDGYGVPELEYKAAKLLDLKNYEEDEPKQKSLEHFKVELFQKIYNNLKDFKGFSITKLSSAFGIVRQTGSKWLDRDINKELRGVGSNELMVRTYYNNLNIKDDIRTDEELERDESSKI